MIDKILAGIAVFALVVVLGIIGYDEFLKQEMTVIVELKQGEDPFVAIRQIVPMDSSIKEVREVDRNKNEYSMIVTTKRKKKALLEWFNNSHRVENVKINE